MLVKQVNFWMLNLYDIWWSSKGTCRTPWCSREFWRHLQAMV